MDYAEFVGMMDPIELATQAAVELDNLVIGRGDRFQAIERLANVLQESIWPFWEAIVMDPTRAIVIHKALLDSGMIDSSLYLVDELKA